MAIQRFEQLEVWQQAHALALEVYRETRKLPGEERFGLQSQMRRAAVSIPANVVEGFKRRTPRDKANFCTIAQGSLEELRYYFILCRDLEYPLDHAHLMIQAERVGRMLNAYSRTIAY
jgi:four helix bundle protein